MKNIVFKGVFIKTKKRGLWLLPRRVLLPRQGFPRVTRVKDKLENLLKDFKHNSVRKNQNPELSALPLQAV
jgi:hypothetical protein